MKLSKCNVTVQGALFQRVITVNPCDSEESAIKIVMESEMCPRHCIIDVQLVEVAS